MELPGAPRHQGYLFVALVGSDWMARSATLPAKPVASVWVVLLVLNVIGGLTTLSVGLRPFSQSRNVATWLKRHHLEDAFLIGVRDSTTSPIAGYLGRPLYYLECQCLGTHVVWNNRRRRTLKLKEVVKRTARGMTAAHKSDAILMTSLPYELNGQTIVPGLAFEPLKQFPSAIVGDETYVIYRVRARKTAGPPP